MSRFFDWKCDDCGTVKEVYENFNNEPHVCECGKVMRRLFSNPPTHNFKDLPKGHNLNATQRRELFNSPDPKEFRQIM